MILPQIPLPADYLRLTIPEPLSSLAHSCETVCVAGCCGVDAFDVTAEQMVSWIRSAGREPAYQALHQIDELVAQAAGQAGKIVSEDFNATRTPEQSIAYFRLWREQLDRALT